MAIGIKGLRIDDVAITAKESGDEIQGHYSIISTMDKVIAKQSFNGYNDIKITMSQETQTLLSSFLSSLKKDVETITGLVE